MTAPAPGGRRRRRATGVVASAVAGAARALVAALSARAAPGTDLASRPCAHRCAGALTRFVAVGDSCAAETHVCERPMLDSDWTSVILSVACIRAV